MRKGIEVRFEAGDRERLEAVIGSGNSPQKHVWRARIHRLAVHGVTAAIVGMAGGAMVRPMRQALMNDCGSRREAQYLLFANPSLFGD